ncbi:SUMF1/EgtB/PvdO family nonheme iron enzyme [Treponema sp.]|uniref:SUMF1/EgtB/PvdO family nonheme iron enzyme n=1 Tax=Treponema sp. TaxID=166 RepID=UPI00298DC4DF|nr:SUMF1/EgtB/PvdO family nonheme iron enzyme [Treponema sp.]MCQ2241615.1 formylglycine-generating enzyme family protein [Treponema sp.]
MKDELQKVNQITDKKFNYNLNIPEGINVIDINIDEFPSEPSLYHFWEMYWRCNKIKIPGSVKRIASFDIAEYEGYEGIWFNYDDRYRLPFLYIPATVETVENFRCEAFDAVFFESKELLDKTLLFGMPNVHILPAARKGPENTFEFIDLPGTDIKMQATMVTQELYEKITGINPSFFKEGSVSYKYLYDRESLDLYPEDNPKTLPVEKVNVIDIAIFCNKLSQSKGLQPVFSVNGTTDVSKWEYDEKKGLPIDIGNFKLKIDKEANGYRLPSYEEMQFVIRGFHREPDVEVDSINEDYWFDNYETFEASCWYEMNSNGHTHSVGTRAPSPLGLYDVLGNLNEFCYVENNEQELEFRRVGLNMLDTFYTYNGFSYIHDIDEYTPLVDAYYECKNIEERNFRNGFRLVCKK